MEHKLGGNRAVLVVSPLVALMKHHIKSQPIRQCQRLDGSRLEDAVRGGSLLRAVLCKQMIAQNDSRGSFRCKTFQDLVNVALPHQIQ